MDTDTDPGALRGRALAAWRKARSVELAAAGCTYTEIAAEVGYGHSGEAQRAVLEALAERADQAVAALFAVDPKTVTRWAKAGKLPCITTLGGHRRYPEAEVRALLEQPTEQPPA